MATVNNGPSISQTQNLQAAMTPTLGGLGAQGVLQANLPAPSLYPPKNGLFTIAYTIDSGPLYSDGTTWNAMGGSSGGALIGYQILTGSGTYTPTAGTSAIYVIGQAPGGGSGGADVGNVVPTATAGASAGGRASKYITSPAASYAFDCGTPGAAGSAAPGNGGNATDLTFGSVLTVPGGIGSANDGSGGESPAIPTGGDINIAGQAGAFPLFDLTTSAIYTSGLGGSTPYGNAGQQRNSTIGAGGIAPVCQGYGAGATGSQNETASAIAGQIGGSGVIFVWEYS